MPRKKTPTYELKRRKLPNGNLSENFYARLPDESGKRQYVSFGSDYKIAQKKLKDELAKRAKQKALAEETKPSKEEVQSFLKYVREKHFLGCEEKGAKLSDNPKYLLNPLFLRAKNSTKVRYGITRARSVNNILRRLLIDCNDEIGLCQFNKIKKPDVVNLKNRLESGKLADNFKTVPMKNSVLECLSSIYSYIKEHDPSVEYNPFRDKELRFEEDEEIREPLNRLQVQALFPSEQEINAKYRKQRMEDERLTRETAIQKIKKKNISDKAKESFITMIKKQSDGRLKKIEEEPDFTTTTFYFFFLFCLATGCRKGEARALQYSSFRDFPYVRIERSFNTERNSRNDIGLPKMKIQRVIFLCDTLKEKLSYCKPVLTSIQNNTREYSKAAEAFVFSEDEDGMKPLGITQLWNHWNTFIRAMGFTTNRITFHFLRHTFESMLDSEPDVKEAWIAKYCGWENPNESRTQRKYRQKKNPFEPDKNLEKLAEVIERVYFKSRAFEKGLEQ